MTIETNNGLEPDFEVCAKATIVITVELSNELDAISKKYGISVYSVVNQLVGQEITRELIREGKANNYGKR